MKRILCMWLIFCAATACSRNTTEQAADKHKQEILAAIEECEKQGIHQDYNPGISHLKCHDGMIDLEFSSKNLTVDGRQ